MKRELNELETTIQILALERRLRQADSPNAPLTNGLIEMWRDAREAIVEGKTVKVEIA